MLKRKLHKTEITLLISGFLIFISIVLGVIISLSFISANILKALSSDFQAGEAIRFDIDGYDKLGL